MACLSLARVSVLRKGERGEGGGERTVYLDKVSEMWSVYRPTGRVALVCASGSCRGARKKKRVAHPEAPISVNTRLRGLSQKR